MLPSQGPTFIGCTSEVPGDKVLQFDLPHFCEEMIQSARQWHADMSEDPIVAANLPDLMRVRPEGIPPHFVGMPVIA